MKTLIKNVTIADPASPHHGKKVDLLIDAGMFKKIGKGLEEKEAMVIDGTGACLSTGWCDMRANLGEPGYEFKENLDSGMHAAMAGGFTAVAITPDTRPVLHGKAEIEFIRNRTKNQLIDVLPYGAVTHDLDGQNMAEMYDMKMSGAIAFSNGNNTIANTGVMLRALQYVKNFDGLLLSHADDADISNKGKMNEGVTSVMLGMKSIPSMAEELMVQRDIELLRYSGSRLHFSHISTQGSVALIAKAKAEGLQVTCDVAIANLVYDETMLMEFDTNFKVNPPLRTRLDIQALVDAINDGTVDVIVSDHRPQDLESKVVEFDIASNGMNTLQTFYSLLLKLHEKISLDTLIAVVSTNPRKILGLPALSVSEGMEANFTVFHPGKTWWYNTTTNLSRSKNSPLFNTELTGKVIAVGNRGMVAVM
jgi:dihydroorotase